MQKGSCEHFGIVLGKTTRCLLDKERERERFVVFFFETDRSCRKLRLIGFYLKRINKEKIKIKQQNNYTDMTHDK